MMMRITLLLFVNAITVAIYGQGTEGIVNDEFANKPFGIILSTKNMREAMPGKIQSKKESIKNKFTGGFDTLLIFTSNDAELLFYKNTERVFFYRANIVGKGIALAKGVRIGMSKNNFINTFGIKSSFEKDLFTIEDKTGYANHKFHFKNNTLMKIELDAGID